MGSDRVESAERRARSSVGERSLHTREVAGSSPAVPIEIPGKSGPYRRWAKIIARSIRDAGMEVICSGLHQTPEQIVETVIQEDADAVGLSILSV
jgi:methylmalonyl-CoA mutase, C-terminal domain